MDSVVWCLPVEESLLLGLFIGGCIEKKVQESSVSTTNAIDMNFLKFVGEVMRSTFY